MTSDCAASHFPIPPWRLDTFEHASTGTELYRLYRASKHPERSTLSKILRKSFGEMPLLPEVEKELVSFRYSECAQTPELPQKPKIALPPEATPNLAVSLHVMSHKIYIKIEDVPVVIDHGDMLLRLLFL